MRHTKSARKLRFEALETRRMLDGNVTTSFANGVLTLHGDSSSNGVEIFDDSVDVVKVLGLTQGSLPTTIDGGTSSHFQHVVSILVDFNNGTTGVNQGDDAVVLTRLTLGGGVSVQLGNGNDILALGQFDNSGGLVDSAVNVTQGTVSFSHGLGIDLQGGTNTLVAKSVTLDGPAGVNLSIAGAGDDSITLDHVAVNHGLAIADTGSATIGMTQVLSNSMSLALGIGNDTVSIDHTTVAHVLTMNANAGNDSVTLSNVAVGSLELTLGDGDDQLMMTSVAVNHDTTILGGAGDDTATLDTVTAHPLKILMGAGDDHVSLTSVTAKATAIQGGAGADTISAHDIHATFFAAAGGADADTVNLDTIVASRRVFVDGGAGIDGVTVNDLTAAALGVQLGVGADNLTLGAATVSGKTTIGGGVGNDTVTVNGLSAAALAVILGLGNDAVSLQSANITGDARLRGGPGADTYTDATGNLFGNLVKKGIESNPLLAPGSSIIDSGSSGTTTLIGSGAYSGNSGSISV